MLPSELKLTCLEHCYIHLPGAFVSKEPNIKPGSIVSIRSVQNDTELFVIWNGQLTAGSHAELDLNFGQANNLKDELIVLALADGIETADCSLCQVELLDNSDVSIINQHLDAYLLNQCSLVSEGLVIPILFSRHVRVLVRVAKLHPSKDLCRLTKWTEMQIQHSPQRPPTQSQINVEEKEEKSVVVTEDIPIQNPIPFVSYSLGIDSVPPFCLGPMLICGERGSGKSHLLRTIIEDYKKYTSELFNCKQLRGKRPENIKKTLAELLDKKPSILALDDIDSLLHTDPKHDDEKGQDAIYRARLLDIFCDLFKRQERKLLILATCRSLDSLDVRLSKATGRQYFNEIIRIDSPNLQKRTQIIKDIIGEHKQIKSTLSDSEIETVAKRCGSCMPVDLRRLVERSIINACSRSLLEFNSDPLEISLEDLDKSLDGFVPSSLRGVALKPKSHRTFDHVGGMKTIKDELMRTILLQIKYPKLFKKCPIKPQTSILLFGPPGCGKTLIAEALTNQACLNSIYVRGPELLSKYIGASEATVRDLFRRAELAKPCVIFFDEFESLVARRGADSTGVTDRVVNQFLTLMDGVERLSNQVFIIAATSRPDMIDPAILRPGRLDKHIYCPLPDQADRLDILKVLSRDIPLEVQGNKRESLLNDWSRQLEGFTGADIQALLYSAQLKALHELVGGDVHSDLPPRWKGKGALDAASSSSNLEIRVGRRHLEHSFDEMKQEVAARCANLAQRYPNSIRRPKERVAVRATLA